MMRSFSPNREAVGELGDIDGRPVVLHYGDVGAEYAALRTGALLVDRTLRGRLRLSGKTAREILTGLVTNDVTALEPGQGGYAAALTPKGKIVADLRIFAGDESLLVDAPPRAFPGFVAMVKKYVNPRVAPYADESETLHDLCVAGANARLVLAEAIGAHSATLGTLPAYSHIVADMGGATIVIARTPEVLSDAYDCFVPAEAHEIFRAKLIDAGARPGGLVAWDTARVEAGQPEWGLDIDDTTIPQEANLDELHAISYTKGCYVGQETVARVHFRGHVNKHLRGLVFEGEEPAPRGAQLTDDTARSVGDVRSGAHSPRLGAIALAMVRREIEPGATLTATWEGGTREGRVVRLPFPV
ncbi:MAG: aminomethyl transferase family protein [Gemmatimonadaceae bacterium]|nr:aminomethyl transferase family protein [Gemmatimonadaceae bacterium]